MSRWARALPLLLCVGAFDARAVELYRYVNDQGIPVIAYTIPPELVHKGYTVLSEDGKVIRVVERELSPAERVQRDALVNEKRHDDELMRRYSSPRDVLSDRDRKLGEVDQSLARARQELSQSQNRLSRYQREAADAERAGGTPAPATLDNIERAQQQIATYSKEVDQRQQERTRIVEQFKRDAERVAELYNLPADG